eukprot:610066-Pleurochrysis_carterae.AAC.5
MSCTGTRSRAHFDTLHLSLDCARLADGFGRRWYEEEDVRGLLRGALAVPAQMLRSRVLTLLACF